MEIVEWMQKYRKIIGRQVDEPFLKIVGLECLKFSCGASRMDMRGLRMREGKDRVPEETMDGVLRRCGLMEMVDT